MRSSIFFISLGLFSMTLSAQVGGRNTYQFLNLISSPRQAALGGKVITNFDYDVNQPLFNPASINGDMDNQLALNYVSYLAGISYGSAAYAYTFNPRIQTFHLGVTYVNYGSFEGRDEQGNPTGTFNGNEVALSVGYAYRIGGSNFFIGTNLKLISSQLETYTSFGVATDLGALYSDEAIKLNIAIVARNIGAQLTTYSGFRESLPFELDAGISQQPEFLPIRWHITFENLQNWNVAFANPNRAETDLEGNTVDENVGFFQEFIRHTALGLEILPDKGFNLRLGYNFRRAEELRLADLRTFAGFSAGIGIRMNRLHFSYTYARYTLGANASFFGMILNLQ